MVKAEGLNSGGLTAAFDQGTGVAGQKPPRFTVTYRITTRRMKKAPDVASEAFKIN